MLNLGLTIQFSEMFNKCETSWEIEELETKLVDLIEGIASEAKVELSNT